MERRQFPFDSLIRFFLGLAIRLQLRLARRPLRVAKRRLLAKQEVTRAVQHTVGQTKPPLAAKVEPLVQTIKGAGRPVVEVRPLVLQTASLVPALRLTCPIFSLVMDIQVPLTVAVAVALRSNRQESRHVGLQKRPSPAINNT